MNTTVQNTDLVEALAKHRMSFHELLRHLRESRLLNMADLAREAGITKSHISMLESGERRPGMRMIAKLAQAMALNEDDRRLFTERALSAARLPKCKPGKDP